MNFIDRAKQAGQGFFTRKNAIGDDVALARGFLKNGNNKPLVQDWSKVVVSKEELYTGYPYGAIDRRANRVAKLAKYNLKTTASKPIQEKAKKAKEEIIHPYLKVIDESKSFSNNQFWYNTSTYLDLEGVFYILATRAYTENADGSDRIGAVQEFELLNPFNIRRVRNKDTKEIGGYIEAWQGLIREIPPQMIIEIRKLNPFDEDDSFSMIDAAKTAQFTLKQGGDYTRHSLKNNMAAPGVISTDVILEPEQFQNFVKRVTNQEKGLPLFGNGAGAITWDDMQIDLDKSALRDITEISRQELFAVSGTSKTVMGIEESGTTRDTSEAQIELFTEFHAGPQLELIIDALNQDYKKSYPDEYEKNNYTLELLDSGKKDKDSQLKEQELRDAQFETTQKLVSMGYDRVTAAAYAKGDIDVEELGEPTVQMVEVAVDQNDKVILPEEDEDENPQKDT